MSYLVLARKSRPQKFDQVVGQAPVVKTLRNSLIRNRVAHAILFSGVRGVGKTTLARIMAKAINCQESDPALRPCDKCSSCREISSGSALDLYEIDGASNRGIQEIRELKEKIRFLPTSAPFKIIIIDEVHMLTTEAFNALLKTLEEPPAHIHFMFATTEIHKIPITILSRCQQYELKRISASELYDHFQKLTKDEGFEIEQSALSLIVREAAGSVRDGLSLLDQMFSFGEEKITTRDVVEVLGLVGREVLLQITVGLIEGQRSQVLTGLKEIFSFGMDIRRFLEDLMTCFRNLLFCKIDGCSPLIDLPEEERTELHNLAEKYSRQTLHLKLSLLMATAEDMRTSMQPRLTLETSFLKIIEAGNVVSVTTLLGHVDTLLASLPASPQPDISTTPPPKVPEKKNSALPEPEKVAIHEQQLPPQETETLPVHDNIHEKTDPPDEQIAIHPHRKDIRKDWPEFIQYVKERKLWMATDLQRADAMTQNTEGELHLIFDDAANCSLLRQKENLQLLTEYALDFFQKALKVRFILPDDNNSAETQDQESPQRIRQELANDPLVVMTAEIFTGEIGDIRVGPRSR